jgi:hypothetical protein
MDNTILDTARAKSQIIYEALQPYCKAIYLGGSYTQNYIEHPHDIDFICFASNELDRLRMLGKLRVYQTHHKNEFEENDDWIQTRRIDKEEHSYGSYVHKDMILLVGTPVTFTFDPINKDRQEYINILKKYISRNLSIKRYYQIYRGYLLASKQSYDLTEEEIQKLNVLHDAKTEEDLIKTITVPNPDISEENPYEFIKQQVEVDIFSIKLAIWRLK